MHELLFTHLTKYPGMQPVDCIKLLYQSFMGPCHMAEDTQAYLEQLSAELDQPGIRTAESGKPEYIGTRFARVFLSGIERGLSLKTVAKLATLTCATNRPDVNGYLQGLQVLLQLADTRQLPFDAASVEKAVSYYAASVHSSPRHSERYRALYQPHYRVLGREYAFYLPVFTAVDCALLQKPHVLVGIDGMSGSGKSRLAQLLQEVYGCGAIHADDFFLQSAQRDAERLSRPGGNIDYERLAPVARQGGEDRAFRYQAFDCSVGALTNYKNVPSGRVTLLEGVYSLHPKVDAPCDVRVFLSLDATAQANRIEKRNPSLARRYMQEWIPMENRYFSEFTIREGCDVVLDTSLL